MSYVIELKNIIKSYIIGDNKFEALKGINLTIAQGELTAIMGTSGAGKSTLMNIIGLLDTATSGNYLLDGSEVSTLSDDERSLIRNKKIGFIFQSFFLLPKLTALENVMLPSIYHHKRIPHLKDRAMEMLEKVGMKTHAIHKPDELSGGQQQRVAIARSLICKPSMLLADEPTGALDTNTSKEVMQLFEDLNTIDGVTIIIVTHDPGVGKQCHRIVKIQDGLVVDE